MNWLFDENSENSHLLILIFEVANGISGFILLLTAAVLCYFLKKKEHGISDHVLYVTTSALFLLGSKKLIMISLDKWAAYPSFCTFVDVGFATMLLLLIWLLPPLILRVLAAVSREDLLDGLIAETKSKITAQDSAASLGIRNAELQAVLFRLDTILAIQHRAGNPMETMTELREVISSSGGLHRGN